MKTIFSLSNYSAQNIVPIPNCKEVIAYSNTIHRTDDTFITKPSFWMTYSTSLDILTKHKTTIFNVTKYIEKLKNINIKDFKTKQIR